jgi:hypothetical protein
VLARWHHGRHCGNSGMEPQFCKGSGALIENTIEKVDRERRLATRI